MIKQHVYSARSITDNKLFLSAYKCKTGTKLKKKSGNILLKRSLQLFFLIIDRNRYKPEIIIIFRDFLCHSALRLRKIFGKITDSFTLRFI